MEELGDIENVPASATCTFVGEGRANLVFTLTGVDGHPSFQGSYICVLPILRPAFAHRAEDIYQGRLLRVPKHDYNALPYLELQKYWEKRVSPLFEPHELVQQRLVKLPADPAFFRALNEQLRQLDETGSRRRDFVGHGVSEDVKVGMLVEDMRALGGGLGAPSMHEIKPKWLVQSPRAPTGAEQCRNCAREVWRNMKNKTKNQVFCPLNLVKAADYPHDEGVARDVVADLRRCYDMTEAEATNLTAWLRTCSLFKRLRRIQWDNDHDAHIVDDERYCLAMTLRDCSLFALVPTTPDAPPGDVVARLGDTDMKNFAVKKAYWTKMEQEFHDSGVYWNNDKLSTSLTGCQLPFYKARKDLPTELRQYYHT